MFSELPIRAGGQVTQKTTYIIYRKLKLSGDWSMVEIFEGDKAKEYAKRMLVSLAKNGLTVRLVKRVEKILEEIVA